ncbi:HNH endonuclease [Lysobacter sp. CA196]|uniref:HNH endonuclease n=1 Tax=Lysobacter sp. CA196 TaxID=3455606 RepID=UPI003F8D5FBA
MPIASSRIELAEAIASVEWRPIPIAPGYEASSLGTIRNSETLRVLKPWIAGSGYRYVMLSSRGPRTTVHRLVAMTFHGLPPTDKPEVAHFDGNCLNNVPQNLRWASRSENIDDQRRHGTLRPPLLKGEQHGRARLKGCDVLEIRQHSPSDRPSQIELSKRFGIAHRTILHVLNGTTWKHLN